MEELQHSLHKFDMDYEDFVELSDQMLDDPSEESLSIALSQTKRMSRSLRHLMKSLAILRDTYSH